MLIIYKYKTSSFPFVKPREVLNLALRNVFYIQSAIWGRQDFILLICVSPPPFSPVMTVHPSPRFYSTSWTEVIWQSGDKKIPFQKFALSENLCFFLINIFSETTIIFSSPIFLKDAPIVGIAVLNYKMSFFKIGKKVSKYLGCFSKKVYCQDRLKIDQSGHTANFINAL